jgi:restriction endonuclease S subunit
MSQFIEMFKNIPSVKIADCCITVSGGTPNTKKIEYYDGGDIPWLSSGEINQGYIFSTDKYITQLGLENSSAKWVPANSVVIAMYGATAGKVGFIKIPLTTNQAVCTLLPNDGFEPLYLYYATLSKTSWMISQCRGAAQPNISQSIIRSMEIPMATIDEQKRFCKLLTQADKSKFGDFKSQFIEMFSKYPSETPWHKLLTIINGKVYPEEYNDIGTYPICGSAGVMYYGEKKLCDANTIILGRKGNINRPIYMESDYWIVDTAFCLDVNKSILHPKYFYYWCCQYDFTKLNKQGVLPSLTRKDLEKIEMSVPPMAEQKKFVSIAEQADKSKSYVRIALKNLESILGYCIRQVA